VSSFWVGSGLVCKLIERCCSDRDKELKKRPKKGAGDTCHVSFHSRLPCEQLSFRRSASVRTSPLLRWGTWGTCYQGCFTHGIGGALLCTYVRSVFTG
jgi:hypothetical protein